MHLEGRCGGFSVFIILNIYKGNFAFRITNLSFEFVIIIIVYTDDRFWLSKALSIIFIIWYFVVILNVNIVFMIKAQGVEIEWVGGV